MLNTIELLIFPAIMAWAASSDLLTMRITNRLIFVLVGSFVIAAIGVGMPLSTLAVHLGSGLLVLVAAFAMFGFGWIGGGDAKFAAAVSMWLGWSLLLPFLVYASLLGGALTLVLLSLRRLPLPSPLASVGWIDRLHDAGTGVPYGIALAAAGLLVYSDSVFFKAFGG